MAKIERTVLAVTSGGSFIGSTVVTKISTGGNKSGLFSGSNLHYKFQKLFFLLLI